MDKEVLYIYNDILLSQKKKNEILPLQLVDGPRGYYTKWNKSDRERQNGSTCMWN